MPAIVTEQQPFFITRQSANILEDLARQFRSSSPLCVLYGVNGVGKTRLIRQFIDTRLHTVKKHLLSFKADGNCIDSLTGVIASQRDGLVNTLNAIEPGSILIIDRYEFALSDTSMQLFDYLSGTAKSKKIGLILCSTQPALSQLADLANQFDLKINSVELKPMSMQDSIAFIGSRMCKKSAERPRFSGKIKKLIKRSNGLFADLQRLLDQHADEISCKEKSLHENHLPHGIIVLIVMVVAGIAVFYPGNEQKSIEPVLPSLAKTDSHQAETQTASVLSAPSKKEMPESLASQQIAEPSVSESTTATGMLTPESETTSIVDIISSNLQAENATMAPSDARKAEKALTFVVPTLEPQFEILQQRLTALGEWLSQSDSQSSSIQIMTLTGTANPEQALSRYLNQLARKGIDLENILIYSAVKKGAKIYGVLYGRYANRQQALQKMNKLPPALKADHPISRTAKGIKQEINPIGQ